MTWFSSLFFLFSNFDVNSIMLFQSALTHTHISFAHTCMNHVFCIHRIWSQRSIRKATRKLWLQCSIPMIFFVRFAAAKINRSTIHSWFTMYSHPDAHQYCCLAIRSQCRDESMKKKEASWKKSIEIKHSV